MDKAAKIILFLFLLLFLTVVIRTAWVGDDAYITMRTVDNVVRGHGFTWNVSERVQAYTHPLWMFLVIPFYAMSRDAYFTVLILNIVFSCVAFGLVVFRVARGWPAAMLCAVVLVVSKAFVDYSTSGLENALTHLLLALFALVYFRGREDLRDLLLLSLVTALALLNRIDTGPLLAPAFAWRLWRVYRSRDVRLGPLVQTLLLGFAPLIAWEAFSFFYYGFPFPNTAYAKLSTGIPRADLLRQGGCFLVDSLRVDPVTLIVIAWVVAIAWRDDPDARAASLGLLLALVYVVNVGGDFMTGRFLSAPLFMAVLLLARHPLSGAHAGVAAAALMILGLAMPKSPLRSDETYQDRSFWEHNGIADERGMFYQQSGLLRFSREIGELPVDPHIDAGRRARWEAEAKGETSVLLHPDGTVGFFGFAAGPMVHIVDPFALGDPLLARMISEGSVTRRWRIGHFTRSVPRGYLETLRTGENRLGHPDYRRYYDKLSLIVRGPLWSWERFKTIVAMNLGLYNHLLKGKVIFGAYTFAQRTGERFIDATAESDSVLIARAANDEPGYLAFGNYMTLKRGRYEASFRVKVGERVAAPVATLEVAFEKGRFVEVQKKLSGEDFSAAGEWVEIVVPFEVSQKRVKDIEFRVLYEGNADLSLDNVTLTW